MILTEISVDAACECVVSRSLFLSWNFYSNFHFPETSAVNVSKEGRVMSAFSKVKSSF